MQNIRARKNRYVSALVASAAALAIGAGAVASADPPTTPGAPAAQSHPATAHEWLHAWNGTDAARFARLFSRDAVYLDRGVDKVSHGRKQIAAWHEGTFALIKHPHIRLLDALRGRHRVAIETVYSGHIRGAPHPFSLHMASVVRLRGTKIVRDTDYYNLADLLKQSGLPPTWTPPGS